MLDTRGRTSYIACMCSCSTCGDVAGGTGKCDERTGQCLLPRRMRPDEILIESEVKSAFAITYARANRSEPRTGSEAKREQKQRRGSQAREPYAGEGSEWTCCSCYVGNVRAQRTGRDGPDGGAQRLKRSNKQSEQSNGTISEGNNNSESSSPQVLRLLPLLRWGTDNHHSRGRAETSERCSGKRYSGRRWGSPGWCKRDKASAALLAMPGIWVASSGETLERQMSSAISLAMMAI